ncbi:Selenide, water dikinase [Orchesella cincta]|uniref:Selenide, water dikinase n=1 Tax=Orchesella cincta TaxID=48709 RepID=A0A1D2MUR6_ORCCI|nr:Selenide, water dikinase [Orchesella cincta]
MANNGIQQATPTLVSVSESAALLELKGVTDPSDSSDTVIRPFDPAAHDLDANFRLTKYSDFLKTNTWKLPRESVDKLTQGLQRYIPSSMDPNNPCTESPVGVNATVTEVRCDDLIFWLVQATETFYASVDDPYIQGKISCADLLGNLYSLGITGIDSILILMNIASSLSEKERDVVVPFIFRGFQDAAVDAGTTVKGGDLNLNPWLSIGGVATAFCSMSGVVDPGNAVQGDVLVLTKPLGTAIAITLYQWLHDPEKWNRLKSIIPEDDAKKAYNRAVDSMMRLNKTAAMLMHKYNAHGATSVGRYGLLGSAQDLAKRQKGNVSFVIHNLPVIAKLAAVSRVMQNQWRLTQGYSPEISGGLLICLPREQAAAYLKEIDKQESYQAWIIGMVDKGERTARIIDKPRIIEVPAKEKEGELW